MLVVITAENHIQNEGQILNLLFQNGLEILHLRKPGWTKSCYLELIREIHPDFHGKIMIHQFHELSTEFSLKGIHLPEHQRNSLKDGLHIYADSFRTKNFEVSSSFHELSELETCAYNFSYSFLSPVFTSISKNNYLGKTFDVTSSSKTIVALGGIQEQNIAAAFALGFDGVAALGCIWQNENPVHQFNQLNKAYPSVLC